MYNVKVVLDNKVTEVYEGNRLVNRGSRSEDRVFGLNVANPDLVHGHKWSEIKWVEEGHKTVCYLSAAK